MSETDISTNRETSPGRPERPILSSAEDVLAREGFSRRIVTALINRRTGKATGVVIGITGPWGSGKSSILNFIEERIKKDHEGAVVVRFDPWLVSGRNDLISAFIGELLGAIKAEPRASKLLKSATKTVVRYSQHLAPAANLATPGAGAIVAGAFAAIGAGMGPEGSLSLLRAKLIGQLGRAAVPIIVLIDEIDRVEDTEIRVVAQLVRAVADFPGISYVLAYDPERVAQALGAGAPSGEERERGRAYLEKIVQLQLPLPIALEQELIRLVTAELEKLVDELDLPKDFASGARYQILLSNICGEVINTPRDVSRLVGTYHALAGMLLGEVDWLDLLAYSVLLIKAPATVSVIRNDPGAFIDDVISTRDISRRVESFKGAPEVRLQSVIPASENTRGRREVLKFLFPTFSQGSHSQFDHPNALSSRRPLLTTLRLGLLPGDFSRKNIESILSGSADEIAARFFDAFNDDTIDRLIDRLDDLYLDLKGLAHIRIWKGLAKFVRKPDCEWMSSDKKMHVVIRDIASVLERAVRRNNVDFVPIAREVFTNLRNSDENVLTAMWLRTHVFGFGLFGQQQQQGEYVFLSKDQTEACAIEMSQVLRPLHMDGKLIPCRWDLQPVYTMIDTGIWDDECKSKVDEDLSSDLAVDGLTLMLYGNSYTTGRENVAKMCSLNLYLQAVERRLGATGANRPNDTVLAALRKAANGGW